LKRLQGVTSLQAGDFVYPPKTAFFSNNIINALKIEISSAALLPMCPFFPDALWYLATQRQPAFHRLFNSFAISATLILVPVFPVLKELA